MKRAIFTILLISLTTPAFADKWCEQLESTARTIMGTRQDGISLADAMRGTKSIDHDSTRNLFASMLKLAYTKPYYHTASSKQRAVTEFADEIYLDCLQRKK